VAFDEFSLTKEQDFEQPVAACKDCQLIHLVGSFGHGQGAKRRELCVDVMPEWQLGAWATRVGQCPAHHGNAQDGAKESYGVGLISKTGCQMHLKM
jgi:hypothetical protein